MAEHKVPAKVYITEMEHARLVGESSSERQVLTGFGGGRVWLEDVESNAWAFTLLLEWRGLNVSYDY